MLKKLLTLSGLVLLSFLVGTEAFSKVLTFTYNEKSENNLYTITLVYELETQSAVTVPPIAQATYVRVMVQRYFPPLGPNDKMSGSIHQILTGFPGRSGNASLQELHAVKTLQFAPCSDDSECIGNLDSLDKLWLSSPNIKKIESSVEIILNGTPVLLDGKTIGKMDLTP